ncbi:MAG: hypothetical protein AAFY01_07170, partial [Pseudomonadota bacterium]
ETGGESFSPFAWYECPTCQYRVKITPQSDTGSWMAFSLVAWVFAAGLIWLTSKPFDETSVAWIASTLVVFVGPLLPTLLKARRHPVIDGDDPTWLDGLMGNMLFIILLFAVVLAGAGILGLLFD